MNTENRQDTTAKVETRNNVVQMNFTNPLGNLNYNTELGSKSYNGNVGKIDYYDWHTITDILDAKAPNWEHNIKDVRQIGNIVIVTVAITINEITREGLGTGFANSEIGIKKAENDALKRAALKFRIARELYKDEAENKAVIPSSDKYDFPVNPIAATLMDLVTAKQLGMIRAISREIGIKSNDVCRTVLNCTTDELSKKAASAFIQHLQGLQHQQEMAIQQPLRKVS